MNWYVTNLCGQCKTRKTKTTYDLTVTVSDGENSSTENLTVNINNLNDNDPVFTSNATFTADENQTDIGTVQASDADGDTITYSILNSSDFSIDSNTGVLEFNSAPDYENQPNWNVTVRASDGELTTDQSVLINLNNLNDNVPIIASGQSFSFDEGTSDVYVGDYPVSVSDADGTPLTCAFVDIDGDLRSALNGFSFKQQSQNVSSCVIEIKTGSFDYESGNISFTETIRAIEIGTDEGFVSDDVDITFTVNNVNDNAPAWSLPVLSGTDAVGCLFEENSTAVAYTQDNNADAENCILSNFTTDADGSALTVLTYSLSSFNGTNDFEDWDIDPQTGALSPNKELNHEENVASPGLYYYVTINVTDGVFSRSDTFELRSVGVPEDPEFVWGSPEGTSASVSNRETITAFVQAKHNTEGNGGDNAANPLWLNLDTNWTGQAESNNQVYRIPQLYFKAKNDDGTGAPICGSDQNTNGSLWCVPQTNAGNNESIYQWVYEPDIQIDQTGAVISDGNSGSVDMWIADPVNSDLKVRKAINIEWKDPAVENSFTPFFNANNPDTNIEDIAMTKDGSHFVLSAGQGYFALYQTEPLSIEAEYQGDTFASDALEVLQHGDPLSVDIATGDYDGQGYLRVALCTGYYNRDGTTNKGLFKVLERSDSDNSDQGWIQQMGQVYMEEDFTSGDFQCEIVLNDDGKYVAVGDPNYLDPTSGNMVGKIYVYEVGGGPGISTKDPIGTFTGLDFGNQLLGGNGTFDLGGLGAITGRDEVLRIAIRHRGPNDGLLNYINVYEYQNNSWTLLGAKTDSNGIEYSFVCDADSTAENGVFNVALSESGNQLVCGSTEDADADGNTDAVFSVAVYDASTDLWIDTTTKFLPPNNDRNGNINFPTANNNTTTKQIYSDTSASIGVISKATPFITTNGKRLALSYNYGITDVWYWNDYPYNKQREEAVGSENIDYYNQRHLPLGESDPGNVTALLAAMSDNGHKLVKVRKNDNDELEGVVYTLLVRGINMDSFDGTPENL